MERHFLPVLPVCEGSFHAAVSDAEASAEVALVTALVSAEEAAEETADSAGAASEEAAAELAEAEPDEAAETADEAPDDAAEAADDAAEEAAEVPLPSALALSSALNSATPVAAGFATLFLTTLPSMSTFVGMPLYVNTGVAESPAGKVAYCCSRMTGASNGVSWRRRC